MPIYTKTGDMGDTGLLLKGSRVRKDDPRIEALGALDELNSALGAARAAGLSNTMDTVFSRVQSEIFDLGAQIASSDPAVLPATDREQGVQAAHVAALEETIDRIVETLPPQTAFVLPGGCPAAAQLHLARCVCRRAERRFVTLTDIVPLPADSLTYLNRLGDLLFVAARSANRAAGVSETAWPTTGL